MSGAACHFGLRAKRRPPGGPAVPTLAVAFLAGFLSGGWFVAWLLSAALTGAEGFR